jgi:hypothetical protein
LEAETSSSDFDEQRCSPAAVGVSLGNQAFAIAAANSKCTFHDMRNDGNSVGLFQKSFGYALIGSFHDLSQDVCSGFCSSRLIGLFGYASLSR